MKSRSLIRAPKPLEAIGQLGGHLKRGIAHPVGKRTGMPMALVSALPLRDDSDLMVLAFIDRSAPVETFDHLPHEGDNAVIVAPKDEVFLSIVKGVNMGDWRGMKVNFGEEFVEPADVDVDPTGMSLEESDTLVDMIDDLGCDCTKIGGYPLWASNPVDIEKLMGRPMEFHHRISGDLIDFELGQGAAVIYVFVDETSRTGALCWQESGGGAEQTYHHMQD